MEAMKYLVDEYQVCLNLIGAKRDWLDEDGLLNDLARLLMIAQQIYRNAILTKNPDAILSAGSVLQHTVKIIIDMGDVLVKGSLEVSIAKSKLAPVFSTIEMSRGYN